MRTIITIILALCLAVSEAQTFRGGEVFRIKDSDIYWAAVKTSYFREFVARQEEDCWCWAACVQMVLLTAILSSDVSCLAKSDDENEAAHSSLSPLLSLLR